MIKQASKQSSTPFTSFLSIIGLIFWLILYVVRNLTIWQLLADKIEPPTEKEARIRAGGICPP